MNFNMPWTVFALNAEVDAFGLARIVEAHNATVAERDRLTAELEVEKLDSHGLMERCKALEAECDRLRMCFDEPMETMADLRAERDALKALLLEGQRKFIGTYWSAKVDAALKRETEADHD